MNNSFIFPLSALLPTGMKTCGGHSVDEQRHRNETHRINRFDHATLVGQFCHIGYHLLFIIFLYGGYINKSGKKKKSYPSN